MLALIHCIVRMTTENRLNFFHLETWKSFRCFCWYDGEVKTCLLFVVHGQVHKKNCLKEVLLLLHFFFFFLVACLSQESRKITINFVRVLRNVDKLYLKFFVTCFRCFERLFWKYETLLLFVFFSKSLYRTIKPFYYTFKWLQLQFFC